MNLTSWEAEERAAARSNRRAFLQRRGTFHLHRFDKFDPPGRIGFAIEERMEDGSGIYSGDLILDRAYVESPECRGEDVVRRLMEMLDGKWPHRERIKYRRRLSRWMSRDRD